MAITAPTRRLFLSAGVFLLILAVLNFFIHHGTGKSQRRQMLTVLEQIPLETDCIFVGNSLVEAGCDTTAFRAAWSSGSEAITPINLGLGGTSPVEHFLILNRALQRPVRIKYVIYGFFDDQLNAPVRGNWPDLVGNRAFSYYFPGEAAEFYAPGSRLKKWQMWLVGHIPMLAERSSLWSKVERSRRYLAEIGMPKRKTNRFGRVEDFAALKAADVASFNQRCHGVTRGETGFSPSVRELLKVAQQHGAKVILLEMPMPSRHRQVFYSSPAWADLRSYLESLARQEQAIYLSAGDWMQDDEYFQDGTHLNNQGAKVFSARLAAAISSLTAGNPPVTAKANGR
jgi:hypothetical protein